MQYPDDGTTKPSRGQQPPPPPQQPYQYQQYPQNGPQTPIAPPKKRKKLWWIVGIIVVAIVSCGVIANSGESGKKTTITSPGTSNNDTTSSSSSSSNTTKSDNPPPQSKPKTWQTTHTFSGTGAQKTESFTVGDTWKIAWSCNPGDIGMDAPLFITPKNSDNSYFDSGMQTTCKAGKDTKGETQEHKGGTVFLDINSGIGWTVEVLEMK
jgi:hypothetical protein